MSKNDVWTLEGEEIKAPIRYTGCGLDGVWLASGYEKRTIHGQRSLAIRDLDGLHRAIGRSLVLRKKIIQGKELRFLRQQMNLTQSTLARLVGCDAQQIARYEKGENKMSGPADRLVRMLYREHLHDAGSIMEVLQALDELDSRMDEKQVFRSTKDGWKEAA